MKKENVKIKSFVQFRTPSGCAENTNDQVKTNSEMILLAPLTVKRLILP